VEDFRQSEDFTLSLIDLQPTSLNPERNMLITQNPTASGEHEEFEGGARHQQPRGNIRPSDVNHLGPAGLVSISPAHGMPGSATARDHLDINNYHLVEDPYIKYEQVIPIEQGQPLPWKQMQQDSSGFAAIRGQQFHTVEPEHVPSQIPHQQQQQYSHRPAINSSGFASMAMATNECLRSAQQQRTRQPALKPQGHEQQYFGMQELTNFTSLGNCSTNIPSTQEQIHSQRVLMNNYISSQSSNLGNLRQEDAAFGAVPTNIHYLPSYPMTGMATINQPTM